MKATDYVEKQKSKKHGYGIFAKDKIRQGVKIGEYTGRKLACNTKIKSWFLFEVKKKRSRQCMHIIDGSTTIIRFINHANNDDEQNCKFYQYKGRIFLKTIKKIERGNELLAWYGENTNKI